MRDTVICAGAALFAAAAWLLPITSEAAEAAEALRVVVSIKPLHSLVAGVMAGVGTPKLLLAGGQSPHTYTLKPSDARALQEADAVFWVGPALEGFLTKPIAALPAKASRVALSAAPGVALLPARAGGAWEAHDHAAGHSPKHAHQGKDDHDHDHDHDHDGADMHIWLDPVNAKAMVAAIEAALTAARPADSATIRANAQAVAARLDGLHAGLAADLAPLQGRPYIVYHDAYQYFEARYGLSPAGAITLSPDRPASAKRLGEIRKTITASGAACVFAEPQFPPALVETVLAGTPARPGTLDPLGAGLPPGPDAYFTLLGNLATDLQTCLK